MIFRTSPTIIETDEENIPSNGSSGFKAVFGNNWKEESFPGSPLKQPNSDFALKKFFPTNREIDTKAFIKASSKILAVYDFLGKSFLPIKTEVKGHIKGLETKLMSNEDAYEHISKILKAEQSCQKAKLPNSATCALNWIMRHLMFLHNFLTTLLESEMTLIESLQFSYENTLSKHHDPVIKNVFGVSIFESEREFEKFLDTFKVSL